MFTTRYSDVKNVESPLVPGDTTQVQGDSLQHGEHDWRRQVVKVLFTLLSCMFYQYLQVV